MSTTQDPYAVKEAEIRSQEMLAQRLRARQLFLCYAVPDDTEDEDLTELDRYWAYYDEDSGLRR